MKKPRVENKNIYHWKGKRVTEKIYRKRLQQMKVVEKSKGTSGKFVSSPKLKTDSPNSSDGIEGRRIVHIKTLGKNMFCMCCNSILSLDDIESEKCSGLASIFHIKYRQCRKITGVPTKKQHQVHSQNNHFESNTKAVIGAMNSGMGNTHLNKVLAAMNIPEINWHIYLTHQNEVITSVENSAQESCLAAAQEERRLTIQKFDELKIFVVSREVISK